MSHWLGQRNLGLHTIFPNLEELNFATESCWTGYFFLVPGSPLFENLFVLRVEALKGHAMGLLSTLAPRLRVLSINQLFPSDPMSFTGHPCIEELTIGGWLEGDGFDWGEYVGLAAFNEAITSLPRLRSLQLQGYTFNLFAEARADDQLLMQELCSCVRAWAGLKLKVLEFDMVEGSDFGFIDPNYVLPRIARELGHLVERLVISGCLLSYELSRADVSISTVGSALLCLPLFRKLECLKIEVTESVGGPAATAGLSCAGLEALLAPLISGTAKAPSQLKELVMSIPGKRLTSAVLECCQRLKRESRCSVLRFVHPHWASL